MATKNNKNITSDTLTNLEYYLIYIVAGIIIFLIIALLLKNAFIFSVKKPSTLMAFIFFGFGILILSVLFYLLTKYFIPFINY
jgi:hypothetical protein